MSFVLDYKLQAPESILTKLNVVFNINDINTPVGTAGTDYQADNPPKPFMYLVDTFNVALSTLTTLDKFTSGVDGTLVPVETYEQPSLFLANGEMANQIGFSWIVTGYGTSGSQNTNNTSIQMDLGATARNISGLVLVYDMEPGNINSVKHIIAAAQDTPFSASGVLSLNFTEQNLLTIGETVCQG